MTTNDLLLKFQCTPRSPTVFITEMLVSCMSCSASSRHGAVERDSKKRDTELMRVAKRGSDKTERIGEESRSSRRREKVDGISSFKYI